MCGVLPFFRVSESLFVTEAAGSARGVSQRADTPFRRSFCEFLIGEQPCVVHGQESHFASSNIAIFQCNVLCNSVLSLHLKCCCLTALMKSVVVMSEVLYACANVSFPYPLTPSAPTPHPSDVLWSG